MPRILIAGDRTIDWYFYSVPAEDTGENWRQIPSTQAFCLQGGVLLLQQQIAAALELRRQAAEMACTPPPAGELMHCSPEQVIHSNARLDLVTYSGERAWRVGEPLGFLGPSSARSTEAGAAPQPPIEQPDLIVLDDHGNGFRNEPTAWPSALQSWDGSVPLVHKMRQPLDKSRCRDALWDVLARGLSSEHPRYVLVVSADDLRQTEGVQISQGLSWERTALEFLFEMQHAPLLEPLRHCPCVVVPFGWDGAIVYRRSAAASSSEPLVSLHYDPQRIEGGFVTELRGAMFGATSAFVANLVSRLVVGLEENREFYGNNGRLLGELVEAAVPESLTRARMWQKIGFGRGRAPSREYPVAIVFPPDESSPPPDQFSWTVIPPVSSASQADPGRWRIINQECPSTSAVIAREYVRFGRSPGLLRSPMGVFGKLQTVDRIEIESYNTVRRLVQEFLGSTSSKRPLCLGVFGPPGAGKSFGVEEVITSIAGDRVEGLTFNVSQFTTERNLVSACHRIRDKVLAGKTPFVFFDEFDAAGLDGGALGWLRSFLALMQDGKFRDGEEMHPLGKCILVFAGGTAATFREFEELALAAPKERKGRDFVSRLRGYINVLGPNCQGDDPGYVLRRALVLRSMLERSRDARQLFNSRAELQIDEGVLQALLLVSRYEHGVRSLEAVLDMSRLRGRRRFDRSALPPRDQLAIHVPAEEFLALTRHSGPDASEVERLRRWLNAVDYQVRPIPLDRGDDWGGIGRRPQTPLIADGAELRALAEQAHQWWCETEAARGVVFGAEEAPGVTSPYLRPLAELPTAVRLQIDSRVRQIPVILRDAGLEIYRPGEPEDLADPVLIERLAEVVHGSYQDSVNEETAARRSKAFLPLFNPNTVPFAELPPARQESNRDLVRTLPRKLHRVGLALVPRSAGATEPTPEGVELIRSRLEDLAELEHVRWNWQSLLQGYVYKPGLKDDDRRTNPHIVPWSDLPETVRRYDRFDPRFLAGLLFEAGYDVRPA